MLLRLLPPALAAIILAAHFYRAGSLAAAAALGLVVLTFVPRTFAARVVQVGLVAGAVEWGFTLWRLVELRQATGAPYARLALILGAVAVATALSALVFESPALRRRCRRGGGPIAPAHRPGAGDAAGYRTAADQPGDRAGGSTSTRNGAAATRRTSRCGNAMAMPFSANCFSIMKRRSLATCAADTRAPSSTQK